MTQQAAMLIPLLKPGSIVFGHFYGGLVALQISLDRPDLVAGLILVACLIDLVLKHLHSLQSLNSSNMELLTFKTNMSAIFVRMKNLSCYMTILHGENDRLVSTSYATLLAD